jgi:hypothetical protein
MVLQADPTIANKYRRNQSLFNLPPGEPKEELPVPRLAELLLVFLVAP